MTPGAPSTGTHFTGLSEAEATRRLARDGHNEVRSARRAAAFFRQFEVLREPMFGLLLGAAVLYAVIGEPVDAAMLGAFATVSVSIAMVQRRRSDKVLAALRVLSSPRALVIRESIRHRIPGRDVVAGDVLVLCEGDRMAADAMLVAGDDVMADESLLTGESIPVHKRTIALEAGTRIHTAGDDASRLYSGSLIVRGSGIAVTTATGARAEIGKIDTAIQHIQPSRAGLEAETRRWVFGIALLALAVSALAVIIHGLMRGNWLEALLAGVALAMSLLPEELPLVLTVFTVMGAWRLARSRVLTRRPAAIETLGAATVLCTDKTGTLTQNRMSIASLHSGVMEWYAGNAQPPAVGPLRNLLCHARLAVRPEAVDPMDRAVAALADRFALDPIRAQLVQSFPLRSGQPFMAQSWKLEDGRILLAAKGAPEAIARICRLSTSDLDAALGDAGRLAGKGIRVLAVASAVLPAGAAAPSELEAMQLVWRGLLGFADPLRASVPAAISACRDAGVRVVMITGDHPATAAAIAAQAGISASRTLTGVELDALDDAALSTAVATVDVFARIRPEQKLRLVEALKSQGHIVGMTGDGINDAPALKAAHIGIAMGTRGTDVAREAASLVLLDDDFGALAQSVRLGRQIYDNIGKAIGYILSVHVPIAGIALLPILMGTPLVLNPMLIALLELLIDPACSVIFEAEPAERDIMRRPPRDPSVPLISKGFALRSLLQGVLAFAPIAAVYLWHTFQGADADTVRAITFLMLLVANACLLLSHRRVAGSMSFGTGRQNIALAWGLPAATLLVGVVFLWAPARHLLRLGPLEAGAVLTCLAAGIGLWTALQATKKAATVRQQGAS